MHLLLKYTLLDKSGALHALFKHSKRSEINIFNDRRLEGKPSQTLLGYFAAVPRRDAWEAQQAKFLPFLHFSKGIWRKYGRSDGPTIRNVSFLPSRRQIDEFRRVSAQARSDAPFKRPRSGERYREMEDGKGRDVLWSNNRKGHRRLVACGNEGRKRITTSCRRTLPKSLKIAAGVTMI